MKRLIVAVLAIFVSTTAHAGLAYRFDSTSNGGPVLSGKVSAEQGKSRIEIEKGDGMLFESGSLVISGGGSTLNVLNPATKTFYLVDAANLLGGAGALSQFRGLVDFAVRNPRVQLRDGGDGGRIERFATRRTIIDSSYDLAVTLFGQTTPARITSHNEIWTTAQLPAEYANVLQSGSLRTGFEAIDKVMASQAASVKGFPLRQVSTTRVTFGGSTTTTTMTMTVSGVHDATFAPADFAVPAGYTRTESPLAKMLNQLGR